MIGPQNIVTFANSPPLFPTVQSAITPGLGRVPKPGAAVGRLKIAENTSPMPQDRFFFDFSYFQDVPITAPALDTRRFVPGFEKTFFGVASLDVRVPFGTSLAPNYISNVTTTTDAQGQVTGTASATRATSEHATTLGNMTVTLKSLILKGECFTASAGAMLQLPTAPDVSVFGNTNPGPMLLEIDNRSVHYLPFVGYIFSPTDRLFIHGFSQADFDGRGATVTTFTTALTGIQIDSRSDRDDNLLHTDVGVVYQWLQESGPRGLTEEIAVDSYGNYYYSRRGGCKPITAFSTTVEVHHTTVINNNATTFDAMNVVLGANMSFCSNTMLSLAYVLPIDTAGFQKQFDGEFRVIVNRFFGPSAPQPRLGIW